MTWLPGQYICIKFKPREEYRGKYALEDQGHEVYIPMCLVEGKTQQEILFPGYGFARPSEPRWHAISNTRGVAYILGVDGPDGLPECIIDAIRARERNGLVRIRPDGLLRPGDRVKILEELLGEKNREGVVDRVKADKTIRVLIDGDKPIVAELKANQLHLVGE